MNRTVTPGRVTAAVDGDVVVFLIGMRVNRWRSVRHWLPVLTAMPRMLKELERDPESGMLGYRVLTSGPREYMVIQYWESREKLLAYAHDRGRAHRPAWAAFNRRAREGAGRVGIWHETYEVPAGASESVYSGMPGYGLGAVYGVRGLGAAR
ncbi:DUF4188 domain-containing protein [Streptomyces sp. AV19]|uniref:DUF4188 domain-containing protein n=1 Tax=Streptomyces sp. AV19 TaxID=2793068 RepID=UPI0018FE5B91|nr:DUF4188 domain-containing protein [Streptomyces sp. AV19]MBH1933951.1 DUF4188 domain-containing protein [Streptomyces sp. AV19]MDG4535566.1 DUF4188 domain-containing protein [Streptomyces sp. AV19]